MFPCFYFKREQNGFLFQIYIEEQQNKARYTYSVNHAVMKIENKKKKRRVSMKLKTDDKMIQKTDKNKISQKTEIL